MIKIAALVRFIRVPSQQSVASLKHRPFLLCYETEEYKKYSELVQCCEDSVTRRGMWMQLTLSVSKVCK